MKTGRCVGVPSSPASNGEHEARTEIADLERGASGNNLNVNLRCKGDNGATVHR